jgi:branched-subunit amino acid ABC-type transport system permease component
VAQNAVQGAINGLAMGWIYILIALGLSLIFGIMRIVQFAHGEIYMLGAYLAYYLTLSRLPLALAIVVSMVGMGAGGYLLNRLFFRRLGDKVHLSIVLSLGLLLILQTSAVIAFGLSERSLPRLADGSIAIGGLRIATERLIAVLISAAVMGAALLFLKRTRFGMAVVACAQNREGAILQGIDPDKIAGVAMIIGCALAAAGGTVAGSILKLSPFMGGEALSKGLVIVVLGGMGSLGGTIVGGLILGLSDSLGQIYFGSSFATIVPLVLVIAILVVKPQGLFGHA